MFGCRLAHPSSRPCCDVTGPAVWLHWAWRAQRLLLVGWVGINQAGTGAGLPSLRLTPGALSAALAGPSSPFDYRSRKLLFQQWITPPLRPPREPRGRIPTHPACRRASHRCQDKNKPGCLAPGLANGFLNGGLVGLFISNSTTTRPQNDSPYLLSL